MLGLQIYRNRGILRHICQPRHDLDPYPDFFGTAYPDFSPNPIKCGLKNISRLSRMHPGLSPRDSGRSCGSSRRLRTCLRQLAFGSADMQNTKPSARHRRSADWPWRDAATPSGPDAPTGTNAARDADLGRDERMDDSKIRSDLILEFGGGRQWPLGLPQVSRRQAPPFRPHERNAAGRQIALRANGLCSLRAPRGTVYMRSDATGRISPPVWMLSPLL